MFSRLTWQGRKNLARRNWQVNKQYFQIEDNGACNTKVIKLWQ